jgi:hypothetical protein
MHELAPQLSSFMKSFVHVSNMRRENVERAAQLGMDVYRTDKTRLLWTVQPEVGLAGIEWVVVNEADVLFRKFGYLSSGGPVQTEDVA